MMKMKKMLKVGEVAKILNVSRHTVLNWIRKGKMKAIRLPSGRYRVPESEGGGYLKVEAIKAYRIPIDDPH